jgi:hypothetical protein
MKMVRCRVGLIGLDGCCFLLCILFNILPFRYVAWADSFCEQGFYTFSVGGKQWGLLLSKWLTLLLALKLFLRWYKTLYHEKKTTFNTGADYRQYGL